MKRQSLYFLAPGRVEVAEEEVGPPKEGHLLVKTSLSAVSHGTERLFYRGQVPDDMSMDSAFRGMQTRVSYPLKYGYCSVGEVIEAGPGVSRDWLGCSVFAFHPHESMFWASESELTPLKSGFPHERAVFLPNMETALNFVHDGRPLVGECVAVFGLGVVGLLASALLAQFPLAFLVGFDPSSLRRSAGRDAGLPITLDPADVNGWRMQDEILRQLGSMQSTTGFDLCFELSGSPEALDQAISITGYSGRIIIGSWYGIKTVQLNLGGAFHRSRIHLVSSQVSTLAPELSGRWDKQRRIQEVFRQLDRVQPERWISHTAPISAAEAVYRQLDEDPAGTIQYVFTYS